MTSKKDRRIVYSTDPGWQAVCEKCLEPLDACTCGTGKKDSAKEEAHLRRERKGRGGKMVTTISNLKGDLRGLQRDLQKFCGTGGTVKNGVIEIQGDFRDKIRRYLEDKGFPTKSTGG